MDKETKDFFDQKLFMLSTKDDIEKMRQEMKANLRQLKEETRNQVLEWKQEFKTELDRMKKEEKPEDGLKGELNKLKAEIQYALDQLGQKIGSSFKQVQDEARQELKASLQSAKDEKIGLIAEFYQRVKADLHPGKEKMDILVEEINRLTVEFSLIDKNFKDAFAEIKEDLGSMIKFSYADLEKKLIALEARVKTLEKIVLP
jgi:F0F1-type ATP synthase membrane subunit b/b'